MNHTKGFAENADTKNYKIKSSELTGKRVAIGQITFTSIRTYHMLKKDGVDVAMFFDRDYRLQHTRYKGTPIFPWSNFHDAYVILTISTRYNELKKMLIESCGYPEDRILLLDDILFNCSGNDVSNEYDWDWFKKNLNNVSDAYLTYRYSVMQKQRVPEGIPLRNLMVDVNNRCTLNCRYCYTQMPYYRAEEKRNYDMDEIIENLDHLLDVVNFIPYLSIFGGEPLLHPKLHKLISFLNSRKAQERVVCANITTNGTLLLSDEVVEAIKENTLFWRVGVSPYGIHSKKQYELFSQLNEAGIPYYSKYMVYWQITGQTIEPETVDMESIREKCEKCVCRDLHFLNGKLYQCTVLAHFEALHRVPHDNRNSFDCRKSYTKEDLRDFLQSYSPGMAYCSGNHQVYLRDESEMDKCGGKMVPVAEQTEGVLPYKRYE